MSHVCINNKIEHCLVTDRYRVAREKHATRLTNVFLGAENKKVRDINRCKSWARIIYLSFITVESLLIDLPSLHFHYIIFRIDSLIYSNWFLFNPKHFFLAKFYENLHILFFYSNEKIAWYFELDTRKFLARRNVSSLHNNAVCNAVLIKNEGYEC